MRPPRILLLLVIFVAGGCSSGKSDRTASGSPTPTAALVKEHVCEDFHYRPDEVVIACGDGNARVKGLSWSEWTLVRAVGVGTWQENDCVPDCAGGKFHDYPVKLTLEEPMGDAANPFFGRVIADFPSVRPPYPAYGSGHAVLMNHGRYVP